MTDPDEALVELAADIFTDVVELAWVRPFARRNPRTGGTEQVRGYTEQREPGAQGWIPQPDWEKGQAEWEKLGEAAWKAHEWPKDTDNDSLRADIDATHAKAGNTSRPGDWVRVRDHLARASQGMTGTHLSRDKVAGAYRELRAAYGRLQSDVAPHAAPEHREEAAGAAREITSHLARIDKAMAEGPGGRPEVPYPRGAAAVHPGVGVPPLRPGDTISGHAYRHLPQPMPLAEPEPVLEEPPYQTPEHAGPLTSQEFRDRISYLEQEITRAMLARQSTDWLESTGTVGGSPVYSPERADLHNEIVNALMARFRNVPNEGRALMLGGMPGAGKTSVMHANIPGKWLHIDPDRIKEEMAKRDMVPVIGDLSPLEASPLIHEESGHIASLLLDRATAEHKNVVIDTTMRHKDSALGYLKLLRDSGYPHVSAVFAHADPEVARARAEARYRRGVESYRLGIGFGGRYVPPAISEGAAGARQNFEDIKDQFDGHQIYDTGTKPAKLVEDTITPPKPPRAPRRPKPAQPAQPQGPITAEDIVRQLEQGTLTQQGQKAPGTPAGAASPYTGATEEEAKAAEKGTLKQ